MGNIFNKCLLSDFMAAFGKSLRSEIDKLEITDSTDIKQIIGRLKTQYTIEPLSLKDPIPSNAIETTIDRINHWGEEYKQKVYQINVTIPYDGNMELFDCHPSSSAIIYLDKSVHISSDKIFATIILDDLDENKYKSKVSEIVLGLTANIPGINNEISPWNTNLENTIKQLLEQRKGLVSKKFDFMEKIGIKVNPKSLLSGKKNRGRY